MQNQITSKLGWGTAAVVAGGLLTFASACRTHPPTAARAEFNGASPLEWSVRMADSEMIRRGDNLAWREGGSAKWDYTAGLFTLSLLKLNEVVPDADFVSFSERAIGSFIADDGNIRTYKQADFNIDNIAPGKTALALYQLTNEQRYRLAAEQLREQLTTHPRTSGGGFWHKQRYPSQMWLDGLFMGAPFYAEYAAEFGGVSGRTAQQDFDDVARQFQLVEQHLYDKNTGLYFHGWDEKRAQEWANPVTGTSSNFWGRGLGWFVMAQVDTLDFLPKDHPGRKQLIAQLRQTAAGIARWQDAETGLWWQVLDQGGRAGNYRESTAAAMFVYALAKGINRGYLPRTYEVTVHKGYQGIIANLIKPDQGGRISLTQCCSVAGLGYGRDGSYEYYLREPIVDNDLKGVGPFILAGIEVQRLLKLPMQLSSDFVRTEAAVEQKISIAPEWAVMTEILGRIREPQFPDREFSIVKHGAAADGVTDSSAAITAAIAECAEAGGGRVVVPAGEWLTGPIQLRSGVNLHLEGGATLKFKTDPKAYLPAVLTRFEGMECYNYSPFIYAYGQTNIAITGEGTLDGQGAWDNWWQWKGPWKHDPSLPRGEPMQKPARDRLVKMVAGNVPVEQRQFGEGDYLCPNFIQPYLCRNVLIEGVRIRRSPMWEVHPVLCTNVIVRGLHIETHGPNNDGCNPESSCDVLIENTLFDTGDDCIAIKSGRNNDGRRVGVPSQNIIIRNCVMKEGHGGVVIGSEISGGCRNVFVENCTMDSPDLDRAVRFKSNAVRGGVVENIFVRNVTVGTVADAALQIDFLYEEGSKGEHRPAVRNVVIENMTVKNAKRVLDVRGFPGAEISGVRIHASSFENITVADTVVEADVKLLDCTISRKK